MGFSAVQGGAKFAVGLAEVDPRPRLCCESDAKGLFSVRRTKNQPGWMTIPTATTTMMM